MRIREIAERVGGELRGSGDPEITGVAAPEQASAEDIVFIEKQSYIEPAKRSAAGAFLVDSKFAFDDPRPAVLTIAPRLSFIRLLELLHPARKTAPGIHPTAVVGRECSISPSATVMAGCVLGDQVVVAEDVVVHPLCCLGDRVRIGPGSILHPRVVVGEDCVVGRSCILFAGVVIGSEGFGYHDEGSTRYRIPHVGHVVLGDEVEIGANSTVDRAVVGTTSIGNGTKIDNLVQIGHNVQIGAKCYLVAQVGVGGSTRIGDGVLLGGQSGVSDHLKIGDGSIVAGKSAVRESLEPGAIVGGLPALPIRLANDLAAALPQIPQLVSRIRALEKTEDSGLPQPVERVKSWREGILPILARTLNVEPELIGDDLDLKDEFNADSLTVLTVVTEVESAFGISIPDEDIRALRTLGAMVSYLEQNFPTYPGSR